jgi:hypothetical protein
MDHPLIAAGAEQHVLPVDALAVQRDHHLVVVELVGLERAGVPDAHRPAAVLARRDLSPERQVFERMVFGAHGEVIARRVDRDALRNCPRREHAVALEP